MTVNCTEKNIYKIRVKNVPLFGTEWWHFRHEVKDKEKAKELRKKWSKCVDEHSEMISQEVKTNSRYKGLDLK